jgi:GT2 family glycosyltransferase
VAESSARADLIGIVTVLYGSHDVVEGFFASLALQSDVNFRLYVIDNSPTPATLDLCRKLAALHGIDSEFLFNDANVGVARGNNQGIELALRAGCAAVLLANNDTEFAEGTLRQLVDVWRRGAMVVTPKLLYHGPERLIWFGGGRIDAWTVRTPHLGMREIDHGQYDTPSETGYAPTCFLLVDADVFSRVGLMDEAYFVYYDDTDFIWRLRLADVRLRYEPAVVVQHKVSTSTGGGNSPFTIYYSNRNRIYFIRKNYMGLRKLAAISYILMTRLPNAAFMHSAIAAKLWQGVRDGFTMPIMTDGQPSRRCTERKD